MRKFYKDPIFLLMLLAPLPVWIWLFAIEGITGITKLAVLLNLVLLYPIVEELIFRGAIQPLLARWLKQRWLILSLANLTTSSLFVLVHLVNHSPAWAIATFIPSLAFGYIQERTNNIAAPIILHCTYNAGYFLLLG